MLDELTNEELAARVRATLDSLPISRAQFAEKVGVSAQAITGWQTTGRISRQKLRALADISGRPLEFFLLRDWEKPAPSRDPPEIEWTDILASAQQVSLGSGSEAQEYAETHRLKFRADSLRRKGLHADKLVVYYARGDSMEPRIHAGDAVLFDTSDTKPRDGDVFVIEWRGELFAKRANVIDGTVYFESDNPKGDHNWTKPRRIDDPRHPINVLGRVRWIGSWEG
jgi:phage repressor protein C with HTH and peptisase S24 domain